MSLKRREVLKAGAGAALNLGLGLGSSRSASAQSAVKVMMDWAWQGPQAPFLLAETRGYYRDAGASIQLDRGFGSCARRPRSRRAATRWASRTCRPRSSSCSAIRARTWSAWAWSSTSPPLCAVADANGPIRTPKDLEGKRIAAPEADGGRQMFPAFAKATGIDQSKINWLRSRPPCASRCWRAGRPTPSPASSPRR